MEEERERERCTQSERITRKRGRERELPERERGDRERITRESGRERERKEEEI